MNPFEALSDDPILIIFSYLDTKDLLNLSQVDQNFYRIIKETSETMAKIPLILDFNKLSELNDAFALTRKLHFTTLKLIHIDYQQIRNDYLYDILKLLNGPVAHLEINSNDDSDEMLKFITGCNQLKSFKLTGTCDYVILYDFLNQQTNLEKLNIASVGVDFSLITCIKLKELTLPAEAAPEASEFLLKQLDLTRLWITISDHRFLHSIMNSICKAPKLVELDINISCTIPANPLKRLENQSIKKMKIGTSESIGWLLEIFRGVNSVDLFYDGCYCYMNLHDLSDVPHGTIDKMKFWYAKPPFHIQFSPAAIPVKVENFESSVLKFAEKFSTSIDEIVIGHKKWRENGNFHLSNNFCEDLVKCLPKLTKLVAFNVADRGKFLSFLDSIRKYLKIKTVKILMPNEDGHGPNMKFETY